MEALCLPIRIHTKDSRYANSFFLKTILLPSPFPKGNWPQGRLASGPHHLLGKQHCLKLKVIKSCPQYEQDVLQHCASLKAQHPGLPLFLYGQKVRPHWSMLVLLVLRVPSGLCWSCWPCWS